MLVLRRSFLPFGSGTRGASSLHRSKRRLATSPSLPSDPGAPQTQQNLPPAHRGEWQVLLNYTRHLARNPGECRFDRCVNVLVGLGDGILQYNKRCGLLGAPTTTWEWHGGALRRVRGGGLEREGPGDLGPPEVLKLLATLSRLRLYHRINGFASEKRPPPVAEAQLPEAGSAGLFSDILDDADPGSFSVVSPRFRSGQCGPLRFAGYDLVAYPALLSNPLRFEITDPNFASRLGGAVSRSSTESDSGPSGLSLFIGSVMAQLLDQLLLLVSNSNFSLAALCVLSMHLAVTVYGPRLHNKPGPRVDALVEASMDRVSDYVCGAVVSRGHSLSFRSLAYLVNACKPRAELLRFVSARVLAHEGPIGGDYLENLCFAFTRCYYPDERLYERLATLVNEGAHRFSPVVAANLLLSFDRVGKLALVGEPLFNRLGSFAGRELRALSPALSESVRRLREGRPLSPSC